MIADMMRLRERILALGGLQAANSYVKVNLSLFGAVSARAHASDSARAELLPGKLIYEMSSWTRAICRAAIDPALA